MLPHERTFLILLLLYTVFGPTLALSLSTSTGGRIIPKHPIGRDAKNEETTRRAFVTSLAGIATFGAFSVLPAFADQSVIEEEVQVTAPADVSKLFNEARALESQGTRSFRAWSLG